jgi:hypothetical protein
MTHDPENFGQSQEDEPKKIKPKLTESMKFRYFYMLSQFVFLLLCGYFLIFSGSLFIESVMDYFAPSDISEFDSLSLILGIEYGLASLFGVIGALLVIATRALFLHKIKVTLYVPAVAWTFLLVMDYIFNYLSDLTYINQFIVHVLVFMFCVFLLVCVIKGVEMPIKVTGFIKPGKNPKFDNAEHGTV